MKLIIISLLMLISLVYTSSSTSNSERIHPAIMGTALQMVVLGDSIKLQCPLKIWFPMSQFDWNPSLPRLEISDSGSVQLTNITFTNLHDYQCSVRGQEQVIFLIKIQSKPIIQMELGEFTVRRANIGQNVELRCEAHGSPKPNVIWRRVSSAPSILTFSRGGIADSSHAAYEINCLSPTDIGYYICQARNSIGEAEKRVQLVIDSDSKTEIPGVAVQYVEVGGSIELHCPLSQKYTKCEIYWKQQNSNLQEGRENYCHHNLLISNLSFSNRDYNHVSCSLTNDSQPAYTFEFRIVLISEQNVRISPWESGVVSRRIGERVALECSVFGSPESTVSWQKLSSISTALMSYQQEDTNSSHAFYDITCLSVENIGYYTCQAENSFQKAEKRIQIVIESGSEMKIQGITVHYVEMGGSMELHCPLTQKYSKCNIYWKQQHGHLQKYDDNYCHHNLLISNISFNDGDYNLVSCSLTKDSEPAYTFEFRIVRISEQNVTITPWESGVVSRRIGDQLTLKCSAYSSPESTVIWQRLASISPDLISRQQEDTNSSDAVYDITCLSVENIGYYTCQAENSFRKAEKRVQIVINSDSKMKIPGIAVQYVDMGASIELHCPLTQEYPKCDIYWKQQNSHLQKNDDKHGHLNLLISNISFNDADHNLVSCSLTNDSQPAYTFEFQIVRISEQNVTITPGESNVLSRRIGDRVTLECSASSSPESTVIWQKLASIPADLIPHQQANTNSSHAVYDITCLSMANIGNYTCQAENSFRTTEKSVQIVMDSDSGMAHPVIAVQYVEMGGSIELHCPLTQKYPKCDIYWKQQNSHLQKNDDNHGHLNLLISNISFNDVDHNLVSCSLTNDSQPAYTFEFQIVRISEQNVTITPGESDVLSRRIGDRVTLECSASSSPESTVIWQKLASIPADLILHQKADTNSSHAVYDITCLSMANIGNYTCQAKNSFRTTEKSVQIVMDSDSGMAHPVIAVKYVEMGGSIELHCPLTQKYPKCDIYWKQQNSHLQKNDDNHGHLNLLISNISFNDVDHNLVSCSLTNDSQPAYTFEFQIVRISEQNVTITPGESDVLSRRIGDRVTLECSASSSPESTVIWKKLASISADLIPHQQANTNSSHAVYDITCLSMANIGNYTCQAKNSFRTTEKSVQIVMDSDSGMAHPVIAVQYVEMGGSIELHCPLTQKYPKCDIYWKQQNSHLQKNDDNHGHLNLLISNISFNDADHNLVSCSLTNDSQPAYTFEFQIVRISEQNVTITPGESDVLSRRIGDRVTLECSASSSPESTVIWQKLASISADLIPHQQANTNSSHAVYDITCLSMANIGNYTCQAKNSFRTTEKSVQIVMDSDSGMGRPVIAVQYVEMGGSIELHCPLTQKYSKCDIHWKQQNSHLQKNDDNHGHLNLLISDISFNDADHNLVSCSLTNDSQPAYTFEFQIVRISEQNVTITPGESDVLSRRIGDRVTLECSVSSSPESTVIWQELASISADLIPHQQANTNSSHAVYDITCLSMANIGNYTCQAKNSFRTTEKSVQIVMDSDNGMGRPVIAVQYVEMGGSIELHCPLTQKYPKCDIHWKQQNGHLQKNDDNHGHLNLLISDISFNDADHNLVSCSLTNDSQPAYTFEFQIVRISEQNVTITPGESDVLSRRIGDRVTLECSASSSPESTVIWQKLASIPADLILHQKADANSSHAVYDITCLSMANIGNYTCQAKNSFRTTEKSVQIVMDSDNGMGRPVIAVQYVEMGGSIELHCPLTQKYPKCDIHWKQQNGHLQKNDDNHGHLNLLISDISFNDADHNLVSCSLTNDSQPAYTFEFQIVRISEQNVTITPGESDVLSRRIGDRVTLECSASSSPESTVIWQKLASIPADLILHQKADANSSHAVYDITCLSMANIGNYTCQAKNSFRITEKSVQIVIDSDSGMGRPVIAVQYVEMGGSIELHCPLTQKYPKCDIHWKQQNSHLQKNDDNHGHLNLLISNISFNDADHNLVSCSLANDSQPAYTFEFQIVRISEQNVTITPGESDVLSRRIGDRVTLECSASSSPESTVIWQKLASIPADLILHQKADTNSSHAVYDITCLTMANIGNYTCQAKNSFRTTEKSVQIVMDSDSGMALPVIAVQYVEMGGSIELHCPLTQKYPKCDIYWKQQNSHLQKNDDNHGHLNLLISNISLNDVDHNLVSCSLTNDSQPAYTFEFQIVRISEQNVTITPGESNVLSRRIGDRVTLECSASSSPESTVIWQELASISADLIPHQQANTNSSHAVYDITCLSMANIGNYTCQAKNSFRTTEKSVQIVIDSDSGMGRPVIAVQYVEMGGSIELHCPLTQKYPKCDIHWKQQNSHLQKNDDNHGHLNLLISNISFNDADHNLVSCSLANDSQPAYTFEFQIVRISEQNVTITPGESDVLSRRIGDRVTLECSASSSPESTVIWQKLASIPADLILHQKADTNSSHAVYDITCLSMANIGNYTCQAKNSFRTTEKSVQIVMDSDSGMALPVIAVQYVEMGGSIELHCPLTQKYPKCDIYWKQQNSHLQKSDDNHGHLNLLISNISFNDADHNLVSCSLTDDSQPAYTFEFQIVRISEQNVTITPGESNVLSRRIGDRVTLECSASSSPESTVIWQELASISADLIPHQQANTNSSHAVYDITCLSMANIGNYTCQAKNSFRTTEKSVQIVIDSDSGMGRPVIAVQYVEMGGSIELHCPLTQKYPKCDIHWKQQNGHLQKNDDNHGHLNLLISDISFNDADHNLVSCSLTNDSQPAYTFEFQIVRISEQNVTITPGESDVLSRRIGDRVTLECSASSSPESTVIWQKLASIPADLILHQKADANSSHAVYDITCLSMANIGNYTCQAKNSFRITEKSVQIVIDSDSGMGRPVIAVQYVEMGGSIELHCPLTQKYPKCDIHWKQQNSHLQKNDDNHGHLNLLISNISFNDADHNLVSCSLANDSQPAYTFEFQIVRISEQNVTITPGESDVLSRRIGDRVTLECSASSSPESTVIWQKLASIPADLILHQKADTNSSHAVYDITCLTMANIGNYTCQAKNSFRTTEKSVQIVMDSDSGMALPVIAVQYVEMGGSIELHCPLTQKYPKCDIYWKQQNSHLQKNDDNHGHLNLLISNISLNDVDHNLVSCSLTNDSQPAYTFEFQIVRISEQNVTITPGESNVLSRRIGDRVTLECSASSSPESTVIWQELASISADLIPHQQANTNSSHAVYDITCLSMANIGNYTCQAKNSFRTTEKSVQIVIDSDSGMGRPVIAVQYVEMGGSIELHCPLTQKYPKCDIHWKQQNSHLQKNDDNHGHLNLLISNISFNDADHNLVSCSLANDSQPAYTFEFQIVRISEQNVTITPGESDVLSRRIGDRVTLECSASSSPESTVIWQKLASIPADLILHQKADTNSSHAVYDITCLSMANIGNYTCQAKNSFRTTEKSVQIVMDSDSGMALPVIAVQYVEMGGSIELHCPLTQKYPKCDIYWKQQNSHLQKSDDNHGHLNLLISNISFNDADHNLVSCSLTDDSQPAYTFEFQIVRISEQNVTITPGESGVLSRRIGDRVTLECSASSSPESTVIWQKLASIAADLILHQKADTNSSHAVYDITCLSMANIGNYTCQAKNSFRTTEKSVQIVMDSDSGMGRPVIAVQYVEMGGSIELHCPLTQKYPKCDIHWKQQNSHLQGNHDNHGRENLLISNISFNDGNSNFVSCSLTNDSQPSYTVIFQIVRLSKPNITITPQDDGKVYVQQCGLLSLSCSASGHPEPTAVWTKSVSKSSISRSLPLININSSSIKHEIPCISRELEGTYTCQAFTVAGKVMDSVQIVVDRSRPGSVLSLSERNPKIECDMTVEIICQINGCCAADFHLMWVRINHPSLPPHSTVDAGVLRIENFTSESEGQYSCVGLDGSGVEIYRTTAMLELQPSSVKMWTNRRPEIGEDVLVYCSVCGAHVISVEWHFERDQPCNVRKTGNDLYIDKFGPGNNGMYTCTVKTTAGSASMVGYLSVGN